MFRDNKSELTTLQLYYNRIEIATLNSDNGSNIFWTFLANVVASLGLGGMSEDADLL